MTRATIYKPKTAPLPHQLEAIDFLVKNNEAAIFDEQGVGKTKEIIDAAITILKQSQAESVLIICPKMLLYTWQEEIKKHSYLVPMILEGQGKSKEYKYLSFANIYIVNYEGVKAELGIIKLLLESQKFIVVLDESQRIKNPDSQTFKSINIIRGLAKRRYILTGTPVANNPIDLWTQFYFLDGGTSLGGSFKEFKHKFSSKSIDKQKLLALREKIRPKSIRRLKENVLELPEKTFESIIIDLAPKQKEIYHKLRKELLIEVLKTDEKVIIDESKSFFKKLLRLVQIASNPNLIVQDYHETPSKFAKLDELVENIIKNKEKVIIWSSFIDNVKFLKDKYRQYGSLCIYGDVSIADRNRYIRLFQEDPEYKVIVANPAAAREGITLTAANNAIYLDRSFNLVDYLQSQDRIHRISQAKCCKIIKLIAKDTIDEFVEDKLSKKQDVANLIQGDIKDFDSTSYLTKEEIIELLN